MNLSNLLLELAQGRIPYGMEMSHYLSWPDIYPALFNVPKLRRPTDGRMEDVRATRDATTSPRRVRSRVSIPFPRLQRR